MVLTHGSGEMSYAPHMARVENLSPELRYRFWMTSCGSDPFLYKQKEANYEGNYGVGYVPSPNDTVCGTQLRVSVPVLGQHDL